MNFHEFEEILNEARKVRTVPLRKTVGGKKVSYGYKLARWKSPPPRAKKSPPVVGGDTPPPRAKKSPPVVGGDTPPKRDDPSLPGETVWAHVKRLGQDVKRPEGSSDASWEKFQNQLKRL
jgi:hypothetical protein